MMNSSWSQRVAETMESLDQEFSQGELAYLALTSKVELPIRDRLAYALHRKFRKDKNICIAREWTERKIISRVDIAVICNDFPRLFVELKTFNSYNLFKAATARYPDRVEDDINKMKRYQSNKPLDRIAMILIPNPIKINATEKSPEGVVKYRLDKRSTTSEDKLKSAVEKQFCRFDHFASGRITGGCAFGVEIDVHYWLFGPY